MSNWVKKLFLHFMPKILMMRRTKYSLPDYDDTFMSNGYTNEIDLSRESLSDPFTPDYKSGQEGFDSVGQAFGRGSDEDSRPQHMPHASVADSENMLPRTMSPEVQAALRGVRFIAQHIKDADKDNEVVEDWKFVSMVLDRFFLWVFTLACIGGTFGIIFQSPSLYDTRIPVDQQLSGIPLRKSQLIHREKNND